MSKHGNNEVANRFDYDDDLEYIRQASSSSKFRNVQPPRYGSGGGGSGGGYYNYFNYYQSSLDTGGSGRYRPAAAMPKQTNEFIQVKLRDLVDPDRNRTFIDNLYAQFESNSNKISLFYVHPGLHVPPNGSRLLSNEAIGDTKLLNDFYMNAYVRQQAYHYNSNIIDFFSRLFLSACCVRVCVVLLFLLFIINMI